MVSKKLWIFVCLVLFLAGCAGGGGMSKSSPGTPARESAYASGGYPQSPGDFNSVQSESAAKTSAAPPAPPSQPGSAPRSSASGSSASADSSSRRFEPSTPAPESRPGLGTEFGEARTSRVHDVSFVRESGRPFAVAALNYNDRRGVDALASVASRRDSARSVATGGGAVTISIRDAGGEPLEAVHVGDRTFVVGQAGQRYSIVLQNHTSHRFEAVGTVDGLDVINGKPGTFDNRGYVLLPFATLEIEGFRTSTSAVAAFRFASVADSYAAQTGSARNVGVIGIAFFGEKGDSFVPESETRLRDTASPFPADSRFSQPPRR
ncbi:MAG: putative outer rane lipoprotein [Labilithrix sp.]|nr:putative outer rane lipoprotein [Labilithrix sp.]